MPASEQPTTYAERLAALNLLRENLFYANPGKYSVTDIAEDLPGSARSVAPVVKNVLPTAAIVSQDPEERKQQIMEALRRIKRSGGAKSELGKEILHNVVSMGGGALTAGFLLSTAANLLGWRGFKGVNAAGQKILQNPFQLSKNIARLSAKKNYGKALLRASSRDALTGAGIASVMGAAYPLYEHANPSSDSALIEAANILQKQPYITSIPGSEMVSAMRNSPEDENSPGLGKIKNIAAGTILGGVAGLAAPLAPAAVTALGRSAANLARIAEGKPARTVLSRAVSELQHEIPKAVSWGAGAGGLTGAFTDRLPADERQKTNTYPI